MEEGGPSVTAFFNRRIRFHVCFFMQASLAPRREEM